MQLYGGHSQLMSKDKIKALKFLQSIIYLEYIIFQDLLLIILLCFHRVVILLFTALFLTLCNNNSASFFSLSCGTDDVKQASHCYFCISETFALLNVRK